MTPKTCRANLDAGPPIGKNVVAASSPAELAESIPFSSLALPEYTLSLAYEADHVFTNLLYLTDHKHEMPVVVKLGHDCLQIASVSPVINDSINVRLTVLSGESRT